jgi:hypothetical protein
MQSTNNQQSNGVEIRLGTIDYRFQEISLVLRFCSADARQGAYLKHFSKEYAWYTASSSVVWDAPKIRLFLHADNYITFTWHTNTRALLFIDKESVAFNRL